MFQDKLFLWLIGSDQLSAQRQAKHKQVVSTNETAQLRLDAYLTQLSNFINTNGTTNDGKGSLDTEL